MARVISKTQLSDPGPSWPSCLFHTVFFRLCLEAAFKYKDTNKSDWFILPTVLKECLLKRETVELKTKSEQTQKDKNTTCCLS